MASYIIRRLLLMVPTLIGISFLVFMLIALSPGGIGAALRVSGGQAQASDRLLVQAYLEDRYGLDDPVLVQYARWLGRISPLKFGPRDQRDPTGEIIRAPKGLRAPPLAGAWYGVGRVPSAPEAPASFELGSTPAERVASYRRYANLAAQARSASIGARARLEQELGRYAERHGLRGFVTRDGKIIESRFHAMRFDASSPGADAVVAAGEEALDKYREALEARRGLEAAFAAGPFPEVGFWLWPGRVSLGPPDFGVVFSRGRPVLGMILDALPITLLLNAIAFPIIYLIAVPTGILAATRQGSWIDVGAGALFVALWSVPVVWAGVLALGYLAHRDALGAFPVAGLHNPDADAMPFMPRWTGGPGGGGFQRGFVLDTLWHICLPVACLVYAGFAVLSKQTRAAMLDNFSADYVRTAKAKGVAGGDIVLRHVFRNSLLPLITIFATLFPAMLSGSVVVERIFSVPGMGSLVIDAINLRDRELLLANVLMIAAVNLVALLIADILYALADPRISYS
ncbi:MAG TPA: hypothetical protein DEB06_02125 [Phycisphaerales bacterium]|nr:hypothetical protein [Phycisphaerales bacterium]